MVAGKAPALGISGIKSIQNLVLLPLLQSEILHSYVNYVYYEVTSIPSILFNILTRTDWFLTYVTLVFSLGHTF